jgi:hypothetical protein
VIRYVRVTASLLVAATMLGIVPEAVTAPPAAAAIALVQTGTEASSTSGSISPTLPTASHAGDLLVAVLANANTSSSAAFSGPAAWTNATGVFQSGNGRVEVWYEANNPGGITSATFTASTGTNVIVGQLTEWSGAAFSTPVDQTGSTTATSTTSATVSTSGATTLTGDLAVTAFTASTRPLTSFTAGTGWTHLFSDGSHGFVSDDKRGLSTEAISETETASSATSWAAVIVAFKPGCTGGSLTLTSPSSVTYPSVTLSGKNQTATVTGVFTPNDQTNSNAGWNIAGTSTTFTDVPGQILPTTATQVTAASVLAAANSCSLPTNSVAFPVTLPAGGIAPPAAKLYNAAANTGAGPSNVTMTFKLTIPASAFKGIYTSTWTFTISSGP